MRDFRPIQNRYTAGLSQKSGYNPNRFNALDSGLSYIILLVLFTVIPYIVSFLIGGFLKTLSEVDYFLAMDISIILSQSIVFLVALVYSVCRKVNPFSGGGYRAKWEGLNVLMCITLIMGIMMTFYYLHSQFVNDTDVFTIHSASSTQQGTILSLLFYLIAVPVFPAIFEEMMFRGIIMRGLEQFGSVFAIIVSGLMFALMHGNFGQLILQFLGGVAIASVVIITKNYLLGCIMHFFNNFFSFAYSLLLQLPKILNWKGQFVIDAFLIIFGIIFLIIGIIYFAGLAFNNYKKKAAGKDTIDKFEKKVYYISSTLETCNNSYEFVDRNIKVEMKNSKEYDDRVFLIHGAFRQLNKKSNTALSYAILGVGILLAIVLIFTGYFGIL